MNARYCPSENREGNPVFLGLVLPPGVTSSATAFKYFDGTPSGTLPWATGRPNNANGQNTLVYCHTSQWGGEQGATRLAEARDNTDERKL